MTDSPYPLVQAYLSGIWDQPFKELLGQYDHIMTDTRARRKAAAELFYRYQSEVRAIGELNAKNSNDPQIGSLYTRNLAKNQTDPLDEAIVRYLGSIFDNVEELREAAETFRKQRYAEVME